MTLTATVLSQPNCQGCTWVKKALEAAGVSYVEYDVRTDRAAEVMLLRLYERRPGQRPATPVTILNAENENTIVFGPDIRSHLKRWTRAVAA
ncbi:glutaredoxin [Mycobacteroides abscessus subsp. abscessus]|uniref:glutaredoxin family protein n=1 Tax=Mycobacteroides abscessus TaxID=36809 RepID=UPI0009A57E2A|nr:glutaredoxin domain-containing protein [Mycobacteroides abscessus]SKM37297.1 glutaredoxin [Mycobacteroides abscessus subsp. abscessus]